MRIIWAGKGNMCNMCPTARPVCGGATPKHAKRTVDAGVLGPGHAPGTAVKPQRHFPRGIHEGAASRLWSLVSKSTIIIIILFDNGVCTCVWIFVLPNFVKKCNYHFLYITVACTSIYIPSFFSHVFSRGLISSQTGPMCRCLLRSKAFGFPPLSWTKTTLGSDNQESQAGGALNRWSKFTGAA